jgi:hypothetical protein
VREPVYAKAGNGRPPVGAERMLRIYFLQQWFNLSDPGVEEALYDSAGMRQFVGIDLGREPVPDETTVCKFRHWLEEHELGERLLERVGEHLQAKGLRLSTGTIVDATISNVYPPALSLQGSRRRGETGEEADQVQSAIQGGTCVCRVEAKVRVREGALSRTGQECEPPVCYLRAGESVPGAQATVVRYGVVPHGAEPPLRGQKQMACLVGRPKPPATTVSARCFAVKITCSEIP